MHQIDPKKFAILWGKQAITDTLLTYCRGVDRCDLALLQSAFWSDAEVHYGQGWESAHEWSKNLLQFLGTLNRTMHSISNIAITVDGEDKATGEVYCHAYHELDSPEGRQEMIVGGRYLDAYERRGDEWKILRRQYVLDWNQNPRSTASWDEGLYAALQVRGQRHPHDISYEWQRRRERG